MRNLTKYKFFVHDYYKLRPDPNSVIPCNLKENGTQILSNIKFAGSRLKGNFKKLVFSHKIVNKCLRKRGVDQQLDVSYTTSRLGGGARTENSKTTWKYYVLFDGCSLMFIIFHGITCC